MSKLLYLYDIIWYFFKNEISQRSSFLYRQSPAHLYIAKYTKIVFVSQTITEIIEKGTFAEPNIIKIIFACFRRSLRSLGSAHLPIAKYYKDCLCFFQAITEIIGKGTFSKPNKKWSDDHRGHWEGHIFLTKLRRSPRSLGKVTVYTKYHKDRLCFTDNQPWSLGRAQFSYQIIKIVFVF
jgi:hypothetical protein